MKRTRSPPQSLFPPLSTATLIGIALFITYVGSAILSAIPIAMESRYHNENGRGGVAALYSRKEELKYCTKLPYFNQQNNTFTPCNSHDEHIPNITKSNRTIYLQPYGGLGNRLRAISSAYTIAQQARANVVIVWLEKEHGFRGKFSDLFTAPSINVGCFPGNALREDNAKCSVHRINHVLEWKALMQSNTAWEKYGSQEVLCLQSMMFLTEKEREISWFYSYLEPVPRIINTIRHFQDQVGWKSRDRWIGMHVRRTDLRLRCNSDFCKEGLKASEVLPLSAYTNATAKIINLANKNTLFQNKYRIFLATDDPLTEVELRQQLDTALGLNQRNGGVLSYKKDVRDNSLSSLQMRNTAAGIEEAVVDLWLLSSSSVLIGTVGSTYSQTAKLIGSPFYVSVGVEFENKV